MGKRGKHQQTTCGTGVEIATGRFVVRGDTVCQQHDQATVLLKRRLGNGLLTGADTGGHEHGATLLHSCSLTRLNAFTMCPMCPGNRFFTRRMPWKWSGIKTHSHASTPGYTAEVRCHTSRTTSPIGERATVVAPLFTCNVPKQSRLGSVTTVIM